MKVLFGKRNILICMSILFSFVVGGCGSASGTSDEVTLSTSKGEFYYFASLKSGELSHISSGWLVGQCAYGTDQYIGYYESYEAPYLAIVDKNNEEHKKLTLANGFAPNQKVCLSADNSAVYYLTENEGIHKYSIPQDKDEILYATASGRYDSFYISADENTIYYLDSANKDLSKIDLSSGEQTGISSKVESFDVSNDEAFLVYDKQDVQNYYYYHDLESGEEKKLFKTKYPSASVDINADGSEILFVDQKEGFFADNRKPVICAYSIAEDKIRKLYTFEKYGDDAESVHWSE